jgi:bifunctional UDP-N-acetylglucosamine pyrophosphorylase/glucosamine-1-phosphate N-acetyltransferase
MTKPAVIILAAGEGTRMKSDVPKVLHKAAGRSLLAYALGAAQGVGPEQSVVVVRHGRDRVAAEALRIEPTAVIADQDEIPGTGRAVQCALAAMKKNGVQADGGIVVMPADTPLLDGETIAALKKAHDEDGNAVTVLTAIVEDPYGYGRVVREPETGMVAGIVEERDATPEERGITEVNSSVYVFDPEVLEAGLASVGRENAQNEVYLTDVIGLARQAGKPVRALVSDDPLVIHGVNDRVQLAEASKELGGRRVIQAMLDGVTVQDPATTWIDADVELDRDVTILQGTHLAGRTTVASGAVVGPFSTLSDCTVGGGATVDRTVATGAVIGEGAIVGPFTHLRPGTRLGAHTKAGSFTELKAAEVADGAKVPHLAYVGDASVGAGSNIGAGTIFANYDGVTKSQCEIGPGVRIGSNNVIVAPVNVGAGAYSGAGAIVRGDVPPGSLAVSAGPQRIIEGWTLRKRPGSDSAHAAQAAMDAQE